MEFGGDITQIALIALIVFAVGGMAIALLYPMLVGEKAKARLEQIADGKKDSKASSFRSRFAEDQKDTRRRQIQDSLNQVGDDEKKRKKKITLRTQLEQAGLTMSPKTFWLFSVVFGTVLAGAAFVFRAPWFIAVGAGFIGMFGLPRWTLGYLRNRRLNVFLNDLADAIDIMVRGLKAGLPVSEAMKIIAGESGPPVGPEFMEVVEGQRIGIPIDQGIGRMVDRVPLAEVNFLAIVMTIQAKTGGNLSEALSNLSRVLRDRKKMKQKIRSMSQEAKSSAAIIGSLPFFIMGALTFMNPTYLEPMFNTSVGNMLLIGSGMWMTMGILVMRHMINFEI
jgi:tight adherence protein B